MANPARNWKRTVEPERLTLAKQEQLYQLLSTGGLGLKIAQAVWDERTADLDDLVLTDGLAGRQAYMSRVLPHFLCEMVPRYYLVDYSKPWPLEAAAEAFASYCREQGHIDISDVDPKRDMLTLAYTSPYLRVRIDHPAGGPISLSASPLLVQFWAKQNTRIGRAMALATKPVPKFTTVQNFGPWSVALSRTRSLAADGMVILDVDHAGRSVQMRFAIFVMPSSLHAAEALAWSMLVMDVCADLPKRRKCPGGMGGPLVPVVLARSFYEEDLRTRLGCAGASCLEMPEIAELVAPPAPPPKRLAEVLPFPGPKIKLTPDMY